jgi:hypothetical protein
MVVKISQLEADYGHFTPTKALPIEPCDIGFLRRRYGNISHQTFLNRRGAVPGITGRKVGKRVLYGQEDVAIFDAIDHYCSKGATLKEITLHWREKGGNKGVVTEEAKSAYEEKAIDIEADDITSDIVVQGVKQQDLENATERLGEVIALKVEKAVERAMKAANQDPLRSQRLLKEAAINGFLTTSSQIADIIGFSKKSVQSWDPVEERMGYRFTRVKKGYWRITELEGEDMEFFLAARSLDEAREAKAARERRRAVGL